MSRIVFYNFCFVLFFSLIVGVRSQKTRLSYAARRARSNAGLRSKNFPQEVVKKKKPRGAREAQGPPCHPAVCCIYLRSLHTHDSIGGYVTLVGQTYRGSALLRLRGFSTQNAKLGLGPRRGELFFYAIR